MLAEHVGAHALPDHVVALASGERLQHLLVLLFDERDRYLQNFFIEGANPQRDTVEAVHEFLWNLGENPILRSIVEGRDPKRREAPHSKKQFATGRYRLGRDFLQGGPPVSRDFFTTSTR